MRIWEEAAKAYMKIFKETQETIRSFCHGGGIRTGYFLNTSLNIHTTSLVIILPYHIQLYTISAVDTALYITE
jgi:hypothetical protein